MDINIHYFFGISKLLKIITVEFFNNKFQKKIQYLTNTFQKYKKKNEFPYDSIMGKNPSQHIYN